MPCLIKALKRPAIKKTIKKTNNRISKNKNFTAKSQYLNLKAACNNVKMQSDKTLAKQNFSQLHGRWDFSLMGIVKNSTK